MKKKIKKRSRALKIVCVFLCICFACGIAVLAVNTVVISSTKDRIISPDEALRAEGADCVLVLGCLVKNNGQPSDMLYDRIRRGAELYSCGASRKLLMSGDHGRVDYNEVKAMKDTAMMLGVPSEDIFMDHAGFDTYDSIYRAKAVFGADKIIIVSQGYHLYRALYIAESLGIEAYGVSSDYHSYFGQTSREIREILARNKDVLSCLFGVKPTYLGESISLNGNGEITEG